MPATIGRDSSIGLKPVSTRITQETCDLMDALISMTRPFTDRTSFLRNLIEIHCKAAITPKNQTEVNTIIASFEAARKSKQPKKGIKHAKT